MHFVKSELNSMNFLNTDKFDLQSYVSNKRKYLLNNQLNYFQKTQKKKNLYSF